MPLFSKGTNNDNGHLAEQEPEPEETEQAQPDEHTRLLPNRVDSNRGNRGFLNPDDPAVSPYNLWSIRALRYLTAFLALVTFVWWILLLVSAFATPPGFHTRGSGFLAFSFASLTLANLLFLLLFFGAPSKSNRILALVMAVSFGFSPT